jgi:isopentenyl-diphosphate Delta-isomerase
MNVANDPLIALIDHQDQITGNAPKLWVHQKGYLHRAFSVFIFDINGRLLMQQRAKNKYHSPGMGQYLL